MDPPAVRVKRLSDSGVELLRVAEPHLQVNENTVSIDYGFFIQGSAESSYRHFNETHRMRYLFLPEIDLMLEKTGFSRRGAYAWMTLDEPGKDSWYACIVAQKKQE